MRQQKDQAMRDRDEAAKILVGERIRSARQAQCITAERLAEAGEISVQYLKLLERGKKCMSFLILSRIASFLGVTADHLIYGRGQELSLPALSEISEKNYFPL